MTEKVEEFISRLSAGEPRAVHAGNRLLGTMARITERGLTRSQIEVLELVAEGHTDAEIARLLFLSREGVSSRVKAARDVLGARTRAHAVALWLRQRG